MCIFYPLYHAPLPLFTSVGHSLTSFSLLCELQPRIDAHFLTYHGDTRFAKIASGRLGEAVVQITGKRTSLALAGAVSGAKGTAAKRSKANPKLV